MSRQLISKVLVLLLAMGLGVSVVFVAQRVRGESDDCHGFGEFLDRTTDVYGQELVACKAGPGHYVVVDSAGHVVADDFLLDEARQYYKEHPEELPKSGPETFQHIFVPLEIPAEAVAAAQQGCAPEWVTTENAAAQARICHPPAWQVVREDSTGVLLNDEPAGVYVVAPHETVDIVTGCLDPPKAFILQTPSGPAKLCARMPEYWGQQWGLVLPSGREVLLSIYNEATPEDAATALRVAANVESLP